MNGDQQKDHRTKTQGLDRRLDVAETVLAALDTRVAGLAKDCDALLRAEAEERREGLLQASSALQRAAAALRHEQAALGEDFAALRCWRDCGFWGRLGWLTFGWLPAVSHELRGAAVDRPAGITRPADALPSRGRLPTPARDSEGASSAVPRTLSNDAERVQ